MHFNLQCKRNDVTPNHVRIRGRWESDEEKRLIKRTEKALLNIKIGQIVKKKDYLKRELDRLEERIKTELPEDLFEVIVKVKNEKKRIEQEKLRVTQRDKYYKLKYGEKYDDYHNNNENRMTERSKVSPIEKSKWVVNISKRKLSPNQGESSPERVRFCHRRQGYSL